MKPTRKRKSPSAKRLTDCRCKECGHPLAGACPDSKLTARLIAAARKWREDFVYPPYPEDVDYELYTEVRKYERSLSRRKAAR